MYNYIYLYEPKNYYEDCYRPLNLSKIWKLPKVEDFSFFGPEVRLRYWNSPSNFIPLRYIVHVYMYLYIFKIITDIFMGLKIWCQVGGRGQKYQN